MDSNILFAFLFTSVSMVSSEYLCVCSHHTQREIYGSPSLTSPPLGFLYKDECKAEVALPNLNTKWAAVQFFHMIAYIEKDSDVDVILCQGAIPGEDKVSTMVPPTTQKLGQTSTSKPTANFFSTTTQKTSGTSRSTIRQTNTTKSTTHLPSTTKSTTHLPSTTKTTTHLPSTIKQHVNVKSTTAPFTIGHIELCPDNVRKGAYINGFKLGQYEHSCYEICNQAVSWFHANDICKGRRGHLVSLKNSNENNFLHKLINHYYHYTTFWIGLNDLYNEERFTWSSGESVSYKNWRTGRKSSSHYQEDCVVMLHNGHWDDTSCGSASFTEPFFTRHPYVCEYGIQEGAVLIG